MNLYNQDTPRVWIVSPRLGVTSEPWLWRQARHFQSIRPRMLYWERHNEQTFPQGVLDETRIPYESKPWDSSRRHLYRLANAWHRNFYAASTAEHHWLREIGRVDQPTAILCHFGHTALRFVFVARDLKVPLIAHFHGLDLSSAMRNRWYRFSLSLYIRSFSDIVVVGEHQRRIVLQLGAQKDRIHVIPCGVPVAEFTPSPKQHRDVIRFICVSRLIPQKGVNRSIEAFAALKDHSEPTSLTIVGDGPERDNLERLAQRLGLADRVHFTGPLSPEETRREMQDSDIFLQHSLTGHEGWEEGFGVSITEASACGLPVVVTDCGGIVDQVIDRENGFVLRQNDVKGFSQAMRRLAADRDLRREIGESGRLRASMYFDTTMQTRKIERLIMRQKQTTDNPQDIRVSA